jgi:hypothetical protein
VLEALGESSTRSLDSDISGPAVDSHFEHE